MDISKIKKNNKREIDKIETFTRVTTLNYFTPEFIWGSFNKYNFQGLQSKQDNRLRQGASHNGYTYPERIPIVRIPETFRARRLTSTF